MFFRRLIIRLRVAFLLIFMIGLITLVAGVLYLNDKGLNTEIRSIISKQLANRGMHVEFDSLSFKISSGLVAENMTIYADETKQSKIATLPSILINLDKTKLLRGIKKINSLTLEDGHLEIPLDPKDPNGVRVDITDINGTINFPDTNSIITESFSASYEGIQIEFTGNLWQSEKPPTEPEPESNDSKTEAYKTFLERLALWHWPADSPPLIKVTAEGDINAPHHIKLTIDGEVNRITRKNFTMEDFKLAGELSHNLLVIDSLKFKNVNKGRSRNATLMGSFDLGSFDGRFHIHSYIHLKEFAKELFDQEILKGASFSDSEFSADGKFRFAQSMDQVPYASALPAFLQPFKGNEFSLRGKAELNDFNYLGANFDTISSDFSYNAGDLYLDKLSAKNSDGILNARLLIKDQKIQFDADSTLPIENFRPFFKQNEQVKEIFSKTIFEIGSTCHFNSSGVINANDLTDWEADGSMTLCKVSYDNNYRIEHLETDFAWKDHFLSTNVKLLGLQLGKTTLNQLETSLKWHKGIFSLKDTKLKDNNVHIGEINTNLKQVEGALQGNITLIDANINGFIFDQLDTNLLNNKDGLTGKINVTKPIFANQPLEHLKASFHYKDLLNIDTVEVKHSTGLLKGSLNTDDKGYVHYNLTSTLHPHLYIPLVRYQNTKDIIYAAQFNDQSTYKLTANGYMNLNDLKDWSTTGIAEVTNFEYNKVPLKRLYSHYDINIKRLIASTSQLDFDYSNYSLKNFNRKSKPEGRLNVDRVVVDNLSRTVIIENAYGKAFPAPVTRMFHVDSADHLEEYKFFDPPTIKASGIFDTLDRPVEERKINFLCNIQCPSSTMMYSVLGGNVLLNNFKANVHVARDSVLVEDIDASTFQGNLKGEIKVMITDDTAFPYSGKFSYLNVNFRDIGITYNFDEIPQGELTGNIHFTGKGDDIRNFDATGNLSLDKGHIFSAPVLGPISLILNPLLPKKGRLSERLKNLSANFTIEKGVLRTDNIHSLTPSLTFTGAGWVDLKTDNMDMTIRINYRGLIGKTMELGAEVIRLPFNVLRALFLNKKPEVAGLLQVRGTGKYKDPRWVPVQFDIDRGFKGKLFNPPKAVIVP